MSSILSLIQDKLSVLETAVSQENAQCFKTPRELIGGSFTLQRFSSIRTIISLLSKFLTIPAALLGLFSHINQQEESHRSQWNSIRDLKHS